MYNNYNSDFVDSEPETRLDYDEEELVHFLKQDIDYDKNHRKYLTLDNFLSLPSLPTDKCLHEDLRKFRAVTKEGVKQLEISIMTNGWTEDLTTDIRLFPFYHAKKRYERKGWMVDPGDKLGFDPKDYRLAIEEGNHRQRAMQNLEKYFQHHEKVPPHLKQFEDKFTFRQMGYYLPPIIACIKTDPRDINPGYSRRYEKHHMEKSAVIPFTIYQSFKIMARDYDAWLKTSPAKLSFTCFAKWSRLEDNGRNQTLYGFLFLREENELMAKWEDDDILEYNRIRFNNFLKVGYPGKTTEEKNKWRKEHLRHLLNLPNDKIIQTSTIASKLIKLLSEGKIKDYNEEIKSAPKSKPTNIKKVKLSGNSLSGDITSALQRKFPDKTVSEVVVKFE